MTQQQGVFIYFRCFNYNEDGGFPIYGDKLALKNRPNLKLILSEFGL